MSPDDKGSDRLVVNSKEINSLLVCASVALYVYGPVALCDWLHFDVISA